MLVGAVDDLSLHCGRRSPDLRHVKAPEDISQLYVSETPTGPGNAGDFWDTAALMAFISRTPITHGEQ